MPFLDWVNKNLAKETPRDVPYHLLKQEAAYGEPGENLLIQGDNLLALKALIPFYAGRVKCIFIDPPYNTQSAFLHYDDKLEHSQWLSMMYPRLVLLRDLLAEDGSIWITIDDHEAHYLKVLMDEVFGRDNFVSTVVWQKRVSPANDAKHFSSDHDHLIVYARSRSRWILNRLPRTEEHNNYYKNPDNDPRGDWNSITYTGNKTRAERPNLYYGITNPNTGDIVFPPDSLTWRYGPETHLENERLNLLYWGKDGRGKTPRLKMFLSDAMPVVPRSVWSYAEAGSTQQSMTEQKALFPSAFGTPKPELLIQRILHIASNTGDLILDSFLGSGTTAAVAQKMNRRYVGIEMGDHARTHCIPRLQKVVEGEQGGISEAVRWTGGGGFRFCTLGESAFDSNGHINPDVRFTTLAAFIWHFETGEPTRQDLKALRLGAHGETAYYLLYNGILGDRRPDGGNVLTAAILQMIKTEFPHPGPKVIYGETTTLGAARLAAEGVTFKQIPYDVKMR